MLPQDYRILKLSLLGGFAEDECTVITLNGNTTYYSPNGVFCRYNYYTEAVSVSVSFTAVVMSRATTLINKLCSFTSGSSVILHATNVAILSFPADNFRCSLCYFFHFF